MNTQSRQSVDLKYKGLDPIYDWLRQEHERTPIDYVYVFADTVHQFIDHVTFTPMVIVSDCTEDIVSEINEIYDVLSEPGKPAKIIAVFVYKDNKIDSSRSKKRRQCADQLPLHTTCLWATATVS